MSSAIQVLASLPFYALWLTAIIVAVIRWNRHPTVSALVLTGGSLQLVASLGRFLGPFLTEKFGTGARDGMMLVYGVIGLVSTLGLGCLVFAVFADRATRSDPPVR